MIKLKLKGLLPYLALSTILFFLIHIIWGIRYETYHPFFEGMITGAYTYHYPTADLFTYFMTGSRWLFGILYDLQPLFPWMSFFFYCVLSVSISVVIYLIDKILLQEIPLTQRLLLLVLIIVTAVFDSIVNFQFSRMAMWACISGLLVAILNAKVSYSKPFYGLALLLFIIGLWIRTDIVLPAILFAVIIIIFDQRSIKPIIPFMLILTPFFIYFFYSYYVHTYYYEYFNFRVEINMWIRNAVAPLSAMKTMVDSVKYEAVNNLIVGDSVNFTPAFYDQVLTKTRLESIDLFVLKFAWNYYLDHAIKWELMTIDALFMALMIFVNRANKKSLITVLFIYLSFHFLLLFSCVMVKMEDWLLFPLHGMFFITLLLLAFTPATVTRYKWMLLFFCSAFSVLTLIGLQPKMEQLKNNEVKHAVWLNEMKKTFKDYIVVVGTAVTPQGRPFKPVNLDGWKKFYFYDFSYVQMMPAYRPFLEKECACDVADFAAFYNFLFTKPNVVFVDEQARINALENFLSVVHHKKYKFKKLEVNATLQQALTDVEQGSSRDLNCYTMTLIK